MFTRTCTHIHVNTHKKRTHNKVISYFLPNISVPAAPFNARTAPSIRPHTSECLNQTQYCKAPPPTPSRLFPPHFSPPPLPPFSLFFPALPSLLTLIPFSPCFSPLIPLSPLLHLSSLLPFSTSHLFSSPPPLLWFSIFLTLSFSPRPHALSYFSPAAIPNASSSLSASN